MRFAIVAHQPTPTNLELRPAWELMRPNQALRALRSGDVALGRLDVRPTLDGVEDGLWALGALAARGVVVLNDASALLATHDKLLTARLLERAGVTHPTTLHVRCGQPFPAVRLPVVVKPRFGSGGAGVTRCTDQRSLDETLSRLDRTPWFKRHGALLQEYLPAQGYDLRLVVVGRAIAGAVFRIAARGEWRTNVALGGIRRPVSDPPLEACKLAIWAARAVGSALVGVDLMLDSLGRWTVIEVNGAVEFGREYRVTGDVFATVSAELLSISEEIIAADARPTAAA